VAPSLKILINKVLNEGIIRSIDFQRSIPESVEHSVFSIYIT
jgi:hypothetical protein